MFPKRKNQLNTGLQTVDAGKSKKILSQFQVAVWQVAVWQVAVWQVAVSNRFRQFQTVEFSFRQLQTGVVAVYTRLRQDFLGFSGSDRSETGI